MQNNTLSAAIGLFHAGKTDEALTIARELHAAGSKDPVLLNFLSVLSHYRGEINDAYKFVFQALAVYPAFELALHSLANYLNADGDITGAIKCWQRAISARPDMLEARDGLVNSYKSYASDILARERHAEAMLYFEKVVRLKPDEPEVYVNMGSAWYKKGDMHKAVEYFLKGLAIKPDISQAYNNLGNTFWIMGNGAEALKNYRRALCVNPEYINAAFGGCIAQLPIIYESEDEITKARDSYSEALERLVKKTSPLEGVILDEARASVGNHYPFFLAYQGRCDKDLQKKFGELICAVMAKAHPEYAKRPKPGLQPGEKIRVGVLSGFFYGHSVWKIPLQGWVEKLDRSRFQLFGYHTSDKINERTREAAVLFDRFDQGPFTFEEWIRIIKRDDLHVLLISELGMDAMTLKLATLRLAPVQANCMGHPETSGMPTVDYVLSSDLMEPENADEHYTEKLVRLPNLCVYYTHFEPPHTRLSRKEIGISEDDRMFWSCQSLYKYLPRFDDVFPRIAVKQPLAKFVFIEYAKGEDVTDIFRRRLDRAFSGFGLKYGDYCVFLPKLSSSHFAAVTRLADVFLDSLGWSGNNSAMEAIAQNLPIVTKWGDFMRGRHAAAIVTRLGMPELIAPDVQGYVDLAVRVASDEEYNRSLREKIAVNRHRLYKDMECIYALERFLEEAVRGLC